MKLELRDELPPNLYILSDNHAYEVKNRSDLLTGGLLQQIVCGNIGAPKSGNLTLFMVEVQGNAAKTVQQLSGNPRAVSLVGFIDMDVLRAGYRPETEGCKLYIHVQVMCICPPYQNQGYGRQLWNSVEGYLLKFQYPRCKTIDMVDVTLEGTITDVSSPESFKRNINLALEQKDLDILEGVLRAQTTGSWKFWRRMGFQPETLIFDNVYMRKILRKPPTRQRRPAKFQSFGPTLLHSLPSSSPPKRSKAKKRSVTFADTDQVQLIEPRSKKPRKS